MDSIQFNQYKGQQMARIENYRQTLEEESGRELTLEKAAQRWVREYARYFKNHHQTMNSESRQVESD